MKTILRKCLFLGALASGVLLVGARDASACHRGWYGTGYYYQSCGYATCNTYPTTYAYQPYYTYPTAYTYQIYYTHPAAYTYPTYYTYPTSYTYQPYYSYPTYYVAGGQWHWRSRRWF